MIQQLPSKCEVLNSHPSITKKGKGDHTQQTHVELIVLLVSWDSVLNLLNVYSSAFQMSLELKHGKPIHVGELI
jgi:hypothetical protein